MKKIQIIIALLIMNCVYSQVGDYYGLRSTYKHYDKDLGEFTNWTEWEEFTQDAFWSDEKNYRKYKYPVISISNHGLKFYKENSMSNDKGTLLGGYKIVMKFLSFEPVHEFSNFKTSRKIQIEWWKGVIEGEKVTNYNYTGTGVFYTDIDFQSLLSGNASGKIYYYGEFNDGDKHYSGWEINKNDLQTVNRLKRESEERQEQLRQEREDLAEELAAKKKREQQQLIRATGALLNTIINKK